MTDEQRRSSSSKEKKQTETVYVVDTNVIINDPNFVKKLNGKILIPKTVIEELDKHKYGATEKARNVRDFARHIDRNEHLVWFHDSEGYEGSNDEKIIKTAMKMKAEGNKVILVTNDILMGMMAKCVGLTVKKHDLGRISSQEVELYQGFGPHKPYFPNQYSTYEDGLWRKYPDGKIKRLGKDIKVWNITHKNAEQRCAIDALMDDNIKLVTLSGKAGTGKTLLALAAGLHQTAGTSKYERVIVSRPVVPMGNDLGFLPGELEEKLSPWMQPIFDNIEVLFHNKVRKDRKTWQDLVKEDILKLEALTYIRGRSIPRQFIIIDEAQNLTRHEVKTIISRVGMGTKIVLTGDVQQIDSPRLDSIHNGLTYTISKFKHQNIAAHVNLTQCERSELAEIATEIL